MLLGAKRLGVFYFLIMGIGLSALVLASAALPNTNQQFGAAVAGAAGLLAIALFFTPGKK